VKRARELAAIAMRRLEANILAATGVTRRHLGRTRGVAVLMYHRVVADDDPATGLHPGMYVRACSFRRQMEWLVGRFPVHTLGELIRRPVPSIGAAVTFDDGWRDNLMIAWPIMEKLGVRGTVFLVRDWVERGRMPEGEFLRASEVAALSAAGMEFGAHTVSHPHLDRLPREQAHREMQQSRDAVEAWTGQKCRLFAYPFGDHNDATVEIAREMFSASVMVGGGWWTADADLARIPRVAIHEDMTSTIPMFARRLAVASGAGRAPTGAGSGS
jgi:peptidoglycan/xylan/chitin deacetylase (PgdA/CDA1 family)